MTDPVYWDLACPDWRERLAERRSLVPALPLDAKAAETAVTVFDKLQFYDVPGNPRLKEAVGDWYRDIVRVAFGSWDAAAGVRYVREIFALIAKKNSKTSNSGALGLTWLLLNERPNAVGIIVAPTQDIADIAFSQAAGMVRLNPFLNRERLRVQDHLKTITHTKTGATLSVFTFSPEVLNGQLAAFWILDELHLIAKSHSADSALRQLRGGRVAIPEAFGIIITTQSEDEPAGVFKAELAKARAIRDGVKRDSRTLPILYEFPEDIASNRDKFLDPDNWSMVVPNLGRSITLPRLRELYAEEVDGGEQSLRRWCSQYLNIEVGLGLKSDHWPGARHWEKNGDKTLTLAGILEASDVIAVGGDGGGLDDILGLTVIGRDAETGQWLAWTHGWLHRDVLGLRKQEAPRFLDFQKQGDLDLVDSIDEAFEAFADLCEQVYDTGKLTAIGLDPVGVKIIVDKLTRRGMGPRVPDGGPVVGVRQGYTMQGTIKAVEGLLSDGRLTHCAQPLLDWSVGNARIKVQGNAIMITKQASGIAKIDPLMALLDAGQILLEEAATAGPSIWDRTDLGLAAKVAAKAADVPLIG